MTILKTITADLQESVVSIYDQTKTNVSGVFSQVIDGVTTLAPPLVKWTDVFTDSGEIILYASLSDSGRLYGMTAVATGGLARVVCYDFDLATGVTSYRGKVALLLPNTAATTHTLRSFKVDDSDVNDVKLIFATTGAVLINGGLFMTNNVPLTDFTPSGFPTIPMAVGNDVKGTYFLQDPSFIGAGQLNTAIAGTLLDRANKMVYVHNGISASHSYFKYDYSINPNCPVSTVTVTIATPGVVSHSGHTFNNNDQVVLSTTGALPTGLTAGTVYFVRNAVASTSYELSATTGGASIATTGTQSGTHSISRAFGITGSNFVLKTAALPALLGTLLTVNAESYAVPGHTANSGSPCVFFGTTTNIYLGKLSELTSAATTWPSLLTSNLLGFAGQIIAPTAINATWDQDNDRAMITTTSVKMIAKKLVNNVIEDVFGSLNNDYLEGLPQSTTVTDFGSMALTEFNCAQGWTYVLGSTVGQRGIIAMKTSMSYRAASSYIISKVMNTPNNLSFSRLSVANQTSLISSQFRKSYRTSGFSTASGGWTVLPPSGLMSGVTPASQIQFKLEFDPTDDLANNPPAAIELYVLYTESISMSDNWRGSVANSSQPLASPFYVAFRLQKAYTTSVPRMYVTITDDSGAVSRYDTVTHAANFTYSTDNGSTWNALGTIPNTALTTELRLNITSPSGNPITAGILEY